jgi:hypothetical protein
MIEGPGSAILFTDGGDASGSDEVEGAREEKASGESWEWRFWREGDQE